MVPPGPPCQPMLLPKGQTRQSTSNVRERTKLPRLNGADIYVARLGWKPHPGAQEPTTCCTPAVAKMPHPDHLRPPDGSLHDELLDRGTKITPVAKLMKATDEKQPSVLSSRPCYRCISYMASVGVRRVFLTNDTGAWEGAKVRDLVDALDKLGGEPPSDVATALGSVFVTKHEVLMLRRMMGER
jgi:hypothetical protein